MSRNSDRQWHCIEIVDEAEGVHSILSLYTTEAQATEVAHAANIRLPQSACIYYWRSKERPVSRPRYGYREGPMSRPDGPSRD